MNEQPPVAPSRFLAWALGSSEEARAVLGDLNEDFAGLLRQEGRGPAHRWYWAQSIPLASSALVWRALGRPIVRNRQGGDGTMGDGMMRSVITSSGLLQDVAYDQTTGRCAR